MSRGLERVWGFLSPAQQANYRERERQYFEQVLVPRAIPWNEQTVKYERELCIQGETFTPTRLFDCQPYTPKHDKDDTHKVISPDGHFSYANMLLPRGTPLELWQGKRQDGKVWFTTDIVIPSLQFGPKTAKRGQAWMSYTPAEVLSQRQGVRLAKGKVVIGGLGMGYFLRQVAAKKSVTEIVVVELRQDLLDWFGNRLVDEVRQASGKKITVICGDAKEHVGQHGADTRYLYDIWDSFPTYVSPEWEKLAGSVEHFWGWGWIRDRWGSY